MKFKKNTTKLNVLSLTLAFALLFLPSASVYAATTEAAPNVISTFLPLSPDAAAITFETKPAFADVTAKLPATIQGTLEATQATTDIPVTWYCTVAYDIVVSEKYVFTPTWDAALYTLSPALDTTTIPSVTVSINAAKSSVYFTDPAKAAEAMTTLASGKTILALVYLTDDYPVKVSADINDLTKINVASGQSVQIIGAAEDSMRNIWYQVTFESGSTTFTGYIERKYLACSDEDFKKFEQSNINTFRQRSAVTFAADFQDVESFPASYQPALRALKEAHPNWLFVPMNTQLEWSSVIKEQNKKARSLVPASSTDAWKNGLFDSSWAYASDGILAYAMDPRNYLDETSVFQFELLTFNPSYHTEAAVQTILNSTFMAGGIPNESVSYASAFYSIGASQQVSPFHLACRVYQEQGTAGTSPLISGTYTGYENLYNYFNIGASGQGPTAVIENGLSKARSMGWTTRMLSLSGGADQISKNYIKKAQDTLYLQKFNVSKNSPYGLYEHQYMQNILAPAKESVNIKKAYASANAIGNSFVFKIPVYNNMPATACQKPTTADSVTLDQSVLSLAVDQTASLAPAVNGSPVSPSAVTFTSLNPGVASVNSSGVVTGIYPGTTTITCTKSGGTTASCQVTIAKATPAVTPPSLAAVTYQPGQVLGSIPLPAGWSFDAPQTVPTVGNTGYPATYTPTDPSKYNTVNSTISLTVSKGTPAYTAPSGLVATVGTPLSSITLPAGFSWEIPTTILQTAGAQKATVSYNPDANNYNTVTGIEVSIQVYASNGICTSHTFTNWSVSVAPTCTTGGLEIRTCTKCQASESQNTAALGHEFTKAVTKEPTDTAEGSATYTCSRCGTSYNEVIGKLPHQHSYTPTLTKVETCAEKGVKTFTCYCGHTASEELPALGHSYSAKVTTEPTEKATGTRTYTCTRCGDSYTETIAKLPSSHTHSYTEKTTREASCTEAGEKTFTCSCGESYKEGIAALGHSMKDGKCTRCGYVEKPKEPLASAPNTAKPPATGGTTGTKAPSADGTTTGTTTPPADGTNTGTTAPPADGTNTSTTTPPADGTASGAATPPTNGTTGTTTPPTNGTNSGTTTPVTGTTTPSTTHTSPGNSASSAPAVTIEMKETTVLYEETLQNVKGNDVDLVLNMGNNVNWTIHGTNITGDDANGVDMGVTLNTGNIPEDKIKEIANENKYMEITLAHQGEFLFQPVLTLMVDASDAGRYANLLYFNPDSQQLEFVAAVPIAPDGTVSLPFSHASDYALVITDVALETPAANADDAPADTATTETADTTDTEADRTGPFSTTTLLIIGVILMLCVGIGVTAYFLLIKKSDEESDDDTEYGDDEDDDEANDEPETEREEDKDDFLANNHLVDENDFIEDDELDEIRMLAEEDDDDDFIDDYHEPESHAKRRGKVINISGTKDETPTADFGKDTFSKDEFDGFE